MSVPQFKSHAVAILGKDVKRGNKDDGAVLKRYIARKRCNLANDPLRKLQKEMRHLRREFQCKQSKFENFCASRNKECAVRKAVLRYVVKSLQHWLEDKFVTRVDRVVNCMFETFIATVSGLIQTQWTIHCQKAVMQ